MCRGDYLSLNGIFTTPTPAQEEGEEALKCCCPASMQRLLPPVDSPFGNGQMGFSLDMAGAPPSSTSSAIQQDPVSSGSSYRPFDEILMEGASCGSVRALAVGVCEAAFVANGILRSTASKDQKVRDYHL